MRINFFFELSKRLVGHKVSQIINSEIEAENRILSKEKDSLFSKIDELMRKTDIVFNGIIELRKQSDALKIKNNELKFQSDTLKNQCDELKIQSNVLQSTLNRVQDTVTCIEDQFVLKAEDNKGKDFMVIMYPSEKDYHIN